MSIKDWMRQKIRNAAGSGYLEFGQESLRLELEKRDSAQTERAAKEADRLAALEKAEQAAAETAGELRRKLEDVVADQSRCQQEASDRLTALEDAGISAVQRQQEMSGCLAALEDARTSAAQRQQEMSGCLAAMEEELQKLRTIATSGRRVHLVEYRVMKLFMYDNDLIPDKTTEEYRRTAGLIDAYDGILNGCNALPLLFEHYWKHRLDFTMLDVGCQYGHESILAGKYIQAHGHSNRIHCFDAGQAAGLMPFNLALNGLDGQAEFHPIAVGNGQEPLLMYYEPGYSEHNRSLNPKQSAEGSVTFSYPVECTTLDRFCGSKGIDGYVIAKLDTEGSEPLILEGMRELMDHRPLSFITEYSPYNFAPEHELEFLRMLLQEHEVLDIGALQGAESGCERQAFRLSVGKLEQYPNYLRRQASGWADLLVLPQNLPYVEELLEKATAATPF